MPYRLEIHARALALTATACLTTSIAATARASGPVERLFQVVDTTADPNALIVRYGAASEGLLFSKDGGKTFTATCTAAIADGLDRIARSSAPYGSYVLQGSDGTLFVNTGDGLWVGDDTGCTWTKQTNFDDKWVASITLDPADPKALLALVNTSTGDGDATEARAELMRRDGAGTWSAVGALSRPATRKRVYGADLIAAKTATGSRLYAAITSSSGAITAPQISSVVVSDDGGKTWRDQGALSAAQERLALKAVDPRDPNRVLAAITSTDEPDILLFSDDQGKRFRQLAEVQELSGVTFDAEGRVFIGDAGDGANPDAPGGVWTAARLGEPLTNIVPNTPDESSGVDCVRFDARAEALLVCRLARVGRMDPASGAFEEIAQLEGVAALTTCPGRDLHAICESQLNEGASWCCAGHYPFTPFCGDYDVTEHEGRRVACGVAGREADLAAGRGPILTDGGVSSGEPTGATGRDGGAARDGAGADREATPERSSGGGCSVGAGTAPLSGLTTALVALLGVLSARRRRTRLHAALSALLLLAACGGDDGPAEDDHSAHPGHGEDDLEDVPCTDDYPRYRANLPGEAGDLTVTVVSATPEPPRQKTPNDWVVEIRDAAGSPIEGATLSNPASYMEVHRHYGKAPPKVAADPTPGRYALNDIDFKMRGPWEVLFDVEPTSGQKQAVSIRICVE